VLDVKAIVQTGRGSLELREIDKPTPRDDTVLVRIHAASVNALDSHLLRLPLRRGTVIGVDVAGQVAAVGRNVTRFRPGDEVFGAAKGAFAEYATTSVERLAPKPRTLSFEATAALPIAGITALQGLRDIGRVRAGQRVLIYGAGGGVGTLAVQVAKAFGAHVTAVTRTTNLDLARSIGADEVIDYTREDFTRRSERYDVIYDLGADRSFADCRRVLAPDGAIVLAGAASGLGAILVRLVQARILSWFGRQRITMFLARVQHADLETLKELAESARLSPVIDRSFPLGEAAEAVRYVGTRGARGKVVLQIA
jgi:NADPH:quinone reductase-like Zn-dependent oxidoreductase